MRQALSNLIKNAAQAITGKGEILIRTYVEGEKVMVLIRDTGCGIPPENIKRIFDPFFTTKPVGSGTGLGLWIVSTLIHSHGGTIAIDSEVGKGTAVTIALPTEIQQ